jgi:Root hair defective 3 GTP-binding protein (RHD3)
MDEFGSNLAGDTTQMAPESALSSASELRKRRSTRIVQAVPLQVTGVDALGRPFVERTSSLILNCHGCRYQSKHYVLKNMWVKLEIPNPEADQPPRTVRGRVAWIQRPRTVRQLFQVALELEVPGNVWGIGFPPEDWFAFNAAEQAKALAAASTFNLPQTTQPVGFAATAAMPAAAAASQTQPTASEAEFHVSLTDADLPPTPGSPDNVRVFPSPASTTDASLQLARHVTRLLAEARQQIHAAAREAATQAVAAERRSSVEQWDHQVAEGREQIAQELAAAITKIQEETAARNRAALEATASALQEDLPRRLAPHFDELTHTLTSKLSEEGSAQRAGHQQQLNEAGEMLRGLCQQAEEASGRLRAAAEQAEAQIAARAEAVRNLIEETARQREESANAHRESVASAGDDARQQIALSLAAAQQHWQSQLTGELEAAQSRWQIAIDNAFASAQQRAADALNERANSLRSELQQEAERQAEAVRQAGSNSRNESEYHANALRDSLNAQAAQIEGAIGRAREASDRLENFSARLDTVQQQALSGFQSQVDDVLSLHRNELHRRSESIFDEVATRIRAAVEEAKQQAVAQFREQVDAVVQPEIATTDEAIQRVAGARSLLDAALPLHQERIRAITEETFAESLAQFRTHLVGVEEGLRASAETITSRNLSDFDARIESVKHKAVEDLEKSAEWYEKKAQTQIQNLAEKVGEQLTESLRIRAGEVAAEFGSEIDQSSRNFISYAQTQMAEVVSDAFNRARGLFTEAAETTTAAFIDEIQRHARQDLDGFDAEVQKSAVEARIHLDAAHAAITEKLTAEQENFLRRFQTEMTGAVEAGVAKANERVQAGFEPLLQSWRSMTEAHQSEMYEIYTRLGEHAAQQYRERLDNVSNQWMLATVSSLDHQSRDAVARIAVTAEEKLRETCTQVFANIGNALRDRLQEIASSLSFPRDKGGPPPQS